MGRGNGLLICAAISAAVCAGAILWSKTMPNGRRVVMRQAGVVAVERPAGDSPGDSPIAREHPNRSRTPASLQWAVFDAVGQDWGTRAQEYVQREEYRPSMQSRDATGGTFPAGARAHFVNRPHGMRGYLDERGIEIGSREWTGWKWRMALEGLARGEWRSSEAQVSPVIDDEAVVYERGWGREIYRNGAGGIEQVFEISTRPAAAHGIEPLEIRLRTEGLRVSSAPSGSVVFADGARDVLAYGKLAVRDAADREVPSRIEQRGSGIALVIGDGAATYPLVVDPVVANPSWTSEPNQDNALFSECVSTAGDVNGDGFSDVIIGAPYFDNGQTDEGKAFVFCGTSSGLWSAPAWSVEGDQAGAMLGLSLSTAGDVNGDGYSDVIVGAPPYTGTLTGEGRVYVYHGSASGLSTTADWTAEGGQAGADFGHWVSTAGDVNGDTYSDVIIGAWHFDNATGDVGKAYVYCGSASGLSSTPIWTAEGDQVGALYGSAVSTVGDVNGDGYSDIGVGAHYYGNGQGHEGRAYIYYGSASGPSSSADWMQESNNTEAYFGYPITTAGDVNGDGYADVIIGCHGYSNDTMYEGRAYVYHGSAAGLSTSPAWIGEGNQWWGYYSNSAASAGDVNGDGYSDVIVGGYRQSFGGTQDGKAYLYEGSASGLSSTAVWTYIGGSQTNALVGVSVAGAGDVNGDGFSDVIVGSRLQNGQPAEGRALVFHGSPSGPSSSPVWTADGAQGGAGFGYAVASAGDVNGDGYSDVIVGAPYYDNGQTDEGRAFLFLGSATGPAGPPAWIFESDQANAYLGTSVASAGDVNGDGYSDVIVGSHTFGNGQADEGRAYVFLGSALGLSASPAWNAEGGQDGAYFGYSVSSAGDVNGDGYGDVVVGAYGFDNLEADEGRAFVYLGSDSGLSASPSWTAESDQAGARFGYSVSTAGDVNGDGYSDVIVGADCYDDAGMDEGRAYVFYGAASGLSVSPNWTAVGGLAGASFGTRVASAGDVNGDGYSDVIVGAPLYGNVEAAEGRALVFYGSSTGLSAAPDWTRESNQAGAELGFWVSTAGDVNGDGFSDVVVSAPLFDNGQTDEGQVYIFFGAAAGLSSTPGWTVESNQGSPWFGRCVSTAGDVNGDGYPDVIVGAFNYDNPETDEGQVFLYFGSGGGPAVRPRQLRADGSAPVQLLGKTSTTAVKIRLYGRIPAGRTRARLQVECKPFGTPFDGGSLTVGNWVDLGTAGVDLEVDVTDLADGSYHWRARLQYFPFMNYGPWRSIGPNGSQEADFRTVVLDTPPAIANPAPADGTWAAAPVLTAEVSAPEIGEAVHAEFSIDGGAFADGTIVTTSGTSSFAAPPLSEGSHTWVARAHDAQAGFSAETSPLTIRVDMLAPACGTPAADSNPNATGTQTLSWTASDLGSGLSAITVERSDDGGPFATVATLSASAVQWTQSPALPEGSYVYRIVAADVAGNRTTSASSVAVIVDTSAPAAPNLLSPLDPTITVASDIQLDWSDVTDTTGVAYDVEVSSSPGFSTVAWNATGLGASAATASSVGVGTWFWRARAVDGAGNVGSWSSTGSFTVLLGSVTVALPSATAGLAYATTIGSAGTVGPAIFTVGSGELPQGLSISPLTGEIVGIPSAPGSYSFTVTAVDSADSTLLAWQTYSIAVGGAVDPLEIVSNSPLPGASKGVAYACLLTAGGGYRPYEWSVLSGRLPDGVSLSPTTGLLSGVPSESGTFRFEVGLTDSDTPAAGATRQIELTVGRAPANGLFSIENGYPLSGGVAQLPDAVADTPFSTTFFARGASWWIVSSGNLPAGLSLDASTGRISGTPTEIGRWGFVIRVSDDAGTVAFLAAAVSIVPNGGALPLVVSADPHAGEEGTFYSWTATAVGGTAPYGWTITAGALPPGLALDAVTGEISGIPQSRGTWMFTLEAGDAAAVPQAGSKVFTLAVEPGPLREGNGGRCGLLGAEVILLFAVFALRRRAM